MDACKSHNLMTRSIAACAILLAIWFNFALVSHQLDTTPSHHLHHQCELFSAAQHGLAQSTPVLSLTTQAEFFTVTLSPVKATSQHFAYLARSPPSL